MRNMSNLSNTSIENSQWGSYDSEGKDIIVSHGSIDNDTEEVATKKAGKPKKSGDPLNSSLFIEWNKTSN